MKMVFMMVLRGLGAALVSGSLLLTAACGTTSETPAASSQPEPLDIVVAFYPFQFVAERLAGPYGTVQNLTEPGAEPHDLGLTPRQVADIAEADLVIYQQSFQPAVDAAVAQQGGDHVLDTATVVPLQPIDEGHDHAEEEGEEEGHDHGGLDPHVWLDPRNMASIAAAVAARLAGADPAHRTDFEANLATLTTQLTDLDRDFAQGLQTCARREFITSHEAFGYLARQYRLEQIAISGLSPEAEPSPARVAEVEKEAREHKITTIFYETLVSPAVAESIAGDLGLRTDVLDPIEGITDQSRGTDYVAIMRSNLAALRTANDCR
jgi:zinc transport system substrate-binding protein